MNLWKQIRLAGAVMCIVAAVTNTLVLTFVGLMVILIGMIGQIDRLERLQEEKDNDETKT